MTRQRPRLFLRLFMTIYRADMLAAQQNYILRRNSQVSFERAKESFGCKERK